MAAAGLHAVHSVKYASDGTIWLLNPGVAVDLEVRQPLGQRCQAISHRDSLLHLLGLALVIPDPFQPLDVITKQYLICALTVEVEPWIQAFTSFDSLLWAGFWVSSISSYSPRGTLSGHTVSPGPSTAYKERMPGLLRLASLYGVQARWGCI